MSHLDIRDSTYYTALKSIREHLTSAANDFVAIGYYLKSIQRVKSYEKEGYKSIWEFAQKELGLSSSTTSRYMAINDKFSVDGNSLILDRRYINYGSSKLIEMLTLEEGKLEEVTPDMTVKQIRELKPKPEKKPAAAEEPEEPEPIQQESIATSQQNEREGKHDAKMQQVYSDCPEGINSCIRQEWGTDPDKQAAGAQECKKCWERWKKLKPVGNNSNIDIEIPEPVNESADIVSDNTDIDTDSVEIVTETPEIVTEEPKNVIDVECTVLDKEEPEPLPEPHISDQMFNDILHYQLSLVVQRLDTVGESWKESKPDSYIKYTLMKRAYELLLAQGNNPDVVEVPELEQPELPILKNNDQRKEWLEKFESWPIWIDNPDTKERYYRYNFEDGNSIVIKVYYVKSYDYIANKDTERWNYREYYLLKPEQHFKNCETNMSALVEYLKDLQKKK